MRCNVYIKAEKFLEIRRKYIRKKASFIKSNLSAHFRFKVIPHSTFISFDKVFLDAKHNVTLFRAVYDFGKDFVKCKVIQNEIIRIKCC